MKKCPLSRLCVHINDEVCSPVTVRQYNTVQTLIQCNTIAAEHHYDHMFYTPHDKIRLWLTLQNPTYWPRVAVETEKHSFVWLQFCCSFTLQRQLLALYSHISCLLGYFKAIISFHHIHNGTTGKTFGLAINRSQVQILLEVTLRNNLGQVVYTCASVTKQYNLVPAKGWWCSEAGKVTAGLAESNGSLPPGGWLTVTCGWLPVHRDQLRAQRSVSSMGSLYLYFFRPTSGWDRSGSLGHPS